MIKYQPNFLDNREIFTKEETRFLEELCRKAPLDKFLNNQSYVEKFGFDFIYTSALIEGNTYDKLDTQALIEYGRTAGGKKYSDAKMILNLRDAYGQIISKELLPTKQTLKDLHYILSAEMVADAERATPRDKEVAITGCDYIPLSTKARLDQELNHLFTISEAIDNPFDQAIYIHNNLAYLQYFTDCNKRTARVMLNVVLKQANCMIYIPDEELLRPALYGPKTADLYQFNLGRSVFTVINYYGTKSGIHSESSWRLAAIWLKRVKGGVLRGPKEAP